MGKPLTPAELRAIAKFPRRRVQKIKQGEFADPMRAELWLIKKPGGMPWKEQLARRLEDAKMRVGR